MRTKEIGSEKRKDSFTRIHDLLKVSPSISGSDLQARAKEALDLVLLFSKKTMLSLGGGLNQEEINTQKLLAKDLWDKFHQLKAILAGKILDESHIEEGDPEGEIKEGLPLKVESLWDEISQLIDKLAALGKEEFLAIASIESQMLEGYSKLEKLLLEGNKAELTKIRNNISDLEGSAKKQEDS